jgi:tetratricopeptide (TPR) repeat protein
MYKLLVALALMAAATIGYLLTSHPEERVAMLMRDGRQAEALAEAEDLIARGYSRSSLVPLSAKLHEVFGHRQRAAELMEAHVAAHPKDVEALSWLAELYTASSEVEQMFSALRRAAAAKPSRELIARLTGLYRLHGKFAEEREFMLRLWNRSLLDPSEIGRLGALLAAAGDVERALELFRRLDARERDVSDRDRLLLFDLLVGSGRYDEARTRAKVWLEKWRKPWVAVQLTRQYARSAPLEQSLLFAEAAIALHPEIRLYLARVLAEQGLRPLAGRLILSWPDRDREPGELEIADYLLAGKAVGDSGAIWRTFALIRAKHRWAEAEVRYAEALANHYGIAAIAGLRPRLSSEVLARRPIFAARLAAFEHDPRLARRMLLKVDLGSISPDERRAWAALFSDSQGERALLDVLASLRQKRHLPADLLLVQARLAERLGAAPEHRLALIEMQRLASIRDAETLEQ